MKTEPPKGARSPAERGGRLERLRAAFLRVPLFYKILVSNGLVVAVVALVSAFFSARAAERDSVVLVVLWGIGVSVVVNAFILKLALTPLRNLEETASRVEEGDLEARADLSPLADPPMSRLVITFNAMLDSGAAYRHRLREVAARALAAAEEERKRIARELHDGTAQSLAALRVRLRLARGTPDPAARNGILEQVSGDIVEAIEEVRRIARGLRPPALDVLGLAPAIESYASSLADAAGIAMDLQTEQVDGLLSPEAELALYRVAQEALSNVVRHSGAGTVRLLLGRKGRQVEMSIEDDGQGFSVAAAMEGEGRGLGLFGMQERAGYMGGRVMIASEPGRGTLVRAMIPIAETSEHG